MFRCKIDIAAADKWPFDVYHDTFPLLRVVRHGNAKPRSGYNESTYASIESNYSATLGLTSKDAQVVKKKVDPYAAVLAGVQKVFPPITSFG